MASAIESVQLAFRERPHMQYGPAVAWFTYPAGCVLQLVQPARITLELSGFLVKGVYEEMLRRFPGNQSLTLVFDFSLMLGRTTASRSQLLGCMRAAVGRVGRIYLTLPPDIRPALERSFQASMQLANELGIDTRVSGSARQAVASCALICAPSSIPNASSGASP
jgi:hypothetical protein